VTPPPTRLACCIE